MAEFNLYDPSQTWDHMAIQCNSQKQSLQSSIWVLNFVLLLTSSLTFDKQYNLSVPQFPHW